MKTNTVISLRLYSFGISRLLDPKWTFEDLYYKIEELEGTDFLRKTYQEGLLYKLGIWMFEDFLEHKEILEEFEEYEDNEEINEDEEELDNIYLFSLKGEYLLQYLDDYLLFLEDLTINNNDPLLLKTDKILEYKYKIYDENKYRFKKEIEKHEEEIRGLIIQLAKQFNTEIQSIKSEYAKLFAERIFHDRQFCAYISNLLLTIGYDGDWSDEGIPKQWISRNNSWPEWAKKSIIARERGKCAECHSDAVMELDSEIHIDHIIPLAQGGTNDLSNLQLLCAKCNLAKGKKLLPVTSSVPKYMTRGKK